MQTRDRLRTAGIAILQVLVFAVVFAVAQMVLSAALAVLRAGATTVETLSVLLAAIVAGIVLLRVWERKPARTLGFPLRPIALPHIGIGFAVGALGLLLACFALVLVGTLRYSGDAGSFGSWSGGMLIMLLVLLIPAAGEEALFRGYPFQKLVAGFGAVVATLGVSAVFAFAHMNNPSINSFALLNIFVAGVVLSVAYLRTRSLWFATGVHLGWNWSMAALLDLPVSGLELFDAPLYEPVDRGPSWLSGGAFGPEAGIAGLLGLLLVLGGVVWLTRKARWLTSIESQ